MKTRYERELDLVQRRLELLRALLHLQGEWRQAFVGLNMAVSERCAIEEELVCRQIRSLDAEIASLQPAIMPSQSAVRPKTAAAETGNAGGIETGPAIHSDIHAALDEMARLNAELRVSNQVRQAILRRSSATIRALRNLFNSYAPTYAAPADPHPGALCEENV